MWDGSILGTSYEYMKEALGEEATPDQVETLKTSTFYGCEMENMIYPIALAILMLYGIDEPHLWHGNTLTRQETFGGLFQGVLTLLDVVLTNPLFGGKEARTHFAYKTSVTQVLFLQHVIDSLNNGGTCGIVLDEEVLFRTNETAFVQTKRKLLDKCDLWAIVSLPGGVFTAAGAGVKTNLLFFTKGKRTEKIWYYYKGGRSYARTSRNTGCDWGERERNSGSVGKVEEHLKPSLSLFNAVYRAHS
jgi:type I restriction enzyme M protein